MRRDEGLDLEDENTTGLDSPKKQKQLILIRLIKSNLEFEISNAVLSSWFIMASYPFSPW